MKPEIFSEIGPLEKVFVYSPGEEHNLVFPSDVQPFILKDRQAIENENFLLFDDIIDLKLAQKQHKIFRDIINFYKEDSCIDIRPYLDEIAQEIGITNQYPLINLMYTRDIAVTVGESILLTTTSRSVRKEETLLAKHFFENNELCKGYNIIDIDNRFLPPYEGGDFFILNKEIILVGISERTSKGAIAELAKHFFDLGFDMVLAIELPKKRSMMHLDTIFTQINHNEFILFDYSENRIKDMTFYAAVSTKVFSGLMKKNHSVLDVLAHNGIDIHTISCGGHNVIFQLREQLTDGANSFALEPGKIIMYNCNDKTIEELEKNGYKHITSQLFKDDIDSFEKILRSDSKVVISIDGSELVKGRGGPRCMTLPIKRGKM